MSRPGLLRTAADRIPADTPYLTGPKSAGKTLSAALDAQTPGQSQRQGQRHQKIGFVWAGNPDHENDHNRSCTADYFARISGIENIALFSLQKGSKQNVPQQLPGPRKIVDLAPFLDDFNDTAYAVGQLDLIITVDTALAYLAGALGHPVWLLLPYAPEWRWQLARDDSPWYPSMRLFRRAETGDWDGVFERVTEALATL